MITTLNYRRIELAPEVPAGWEVVRLKGSNVDSWEGKAGIILIENIPINTFSIIIIRVFLRSAERIELGVYEVPYCFSYCIEGQWQIINQLQHVIIKQNQYKLFFSGRLQCIPLQASGRMNQLVMVTINSNYFSLTGERLEQPTTASPLMMDNILQLTQTSYFPQPRPFHEQLIRSILKIAEDDATREKLPSEKFANIELEALHKVSVLIEKDLQQHHSIASLAVYSGMNRQKLTVGFKSLFGQTIYGYYLSRRMDLAKTLLITSDLPLKMVAKKAGYRSATNFSIAFKKFYKLTPAQMRRQKPD